WARGTGPRVRPEAPSPSRPEPSKTPAMYAVARLASGLVLAAAASLALAQAWPTKPVRIMVGASPGGGTDIIARMLSEKYQATFGQPFIVENRPGASNTIATDIVAK